MLRRRKKKVALPESKAEEDLIERLEQRDLLSESERQQRQRAAGGKGDGPVDKDLEHAKKVFEGRRMGEDEGEGKQVLSAEDIRKTTPEELFKQFDTDGSELIDFEEFSAMLPRIGVNMVEAKAKRYFKALDSDGSGALGLDEFKAALFACDPNSGNSIGFSPSTALCPKDAFKLFDEDGSGNIDEDEFRDVVEYLGLQLTDEQAEKFFRKHDNDRSGYIEYLEFRKIWLNLIDVRGELARRGHTFGKRTPKAVLIRRLEELLEEEEQLEEHAIAQAKAWLKWQTQQDEKTSALTAAKERARKELQNALDVAGQVYTFGVGAYGQFSADAARPSTVFKQFDLVQELWCERIMPEGNKPIRFRNIGQVDSALKKRTPYPREMTKRELQREATYDPENVNDLPGRDELHEERFGGSPGSAADDDEDFRFPTKPRSVLDKILRGAEFGIPDESSSEEESSSDDDSDDDGSDGPEGNQKDEAETKDEDEAGDEAELGVDSDEERDKARLELIMARRRRRSPFAEVVCAPNTAALWGRRVVHVAVGMNTAFALTVEGQLLAWGGRDQWWTVVAPQSKLAPEARHRGNMTDRSALMLSLVGKEPWPDVQEPGLNLQDSEDDVFEKLKFVTNEYYKVWEPSPIAHLRMEHMENIVLPRISFEQVTLTLKVRGFKLEGMNKRQMIDKVHDALKIEDRFAGRLLSESYRAVEQEIAQLRAEKKDERAGLLESTGAAIWRPLHKRLEEWLAEQEHQRTVARETREKVHNDQYNRWRASLDAGPVVPGTVKGKRLRRSLEPLPAPGVLTERGSGPKDMRSDVAAFAAVSAGAFHVAGLNGLGELFTWGDGNYGRLGQGQGPGARSHPSNRRKSSSKRRRRETVVAAVEAAARAKKASSLRYDASKPTLVQDLASAGVASVSCGFSHSAAVTNAGELYVWGGGGDGKLGLGPITEEYECYCPYPVRLALPERQVVAQVACGNAHTAAVTSEGLLYTWGCSDAGRLGLGPLPAGPVNTPQLVRSLQVAGARIKQVSCGCTHTAACTPSYSVVEGTGLNKIRRTEGGLVFVAGPAAVLGKDRPRFHVVKELLDRPVRQVECGYGITACVTVEGELYTWGANKGGCIGHSIHKKFVRRPRLVKCLYRVPKNLARHRTAKQSSTYNGRGADTAVNGERSGKGEHLCCHTQVDAQPFWEVDLGRICVIEKVFMWNREDAPPDSSSAPDMFTRRLFPCWIMVSSTPMDRHLVNAHGQCEAKKKFTKDRRRSVWNLPPSTLGRYVRVQLEGSTYLHFAELEVFGTPGLDSSVGKIDTVTCGKEVMIAVSEASRSEEDVLLAYRRAVRADPANANILRQYPTFFKAWDQEGYGAKNSKCPLDRGTIRCEMCRFQSKWVADVEPGPGGRLRRLDSLGQIVLSQEQPPLNWENIKSKTEGVVANMLKTVDTLKSFFSKSGGKLLARAVAKEKFNMTLHEAEINTNYIEAQFQALKKRAEEELQEKACAEQGDAPPVKADAAEKRPVRGCVACDMCSDFEPMAFNKLICKLCTHTLDTHTRAEASSLPPVVPGEGPAAGPADAEPAAAGPAPNPAPAGGGASAGERTSSGPSAVPALPSVASATKSAPAGAVEVAP